MMKRVIPVLAFLTLLFVNSCSDDNYCATIERKIMQRCLKVDSVYSLKLSTLTNFDWDTLCVIVGPRVDYEVRDITGVDYGDVLQDDHILYLFVRDGKITREFISSCRNRRMLIGDTKGSGLIKYPNSTIVQIKKEVKEGLEYYKLVGLK